MADWKKYCDEIQDELDYFARWFPSDTPVLVGDYGTMEGKKLSVLGNLRDLGLTVIVDSQDTDLDTIDYSTHTKVTFNSKLGASSTGAGSGNVHVHFEKDENIFMKLQDITYGTMHNLVSFGEKIQNLKKDNKWKDSYVFVSKRIVSRKFLIMIAESNDSTFTMNGKVSQAVTGVAAIDLDDLTVTSTSGSFARYDNRDGTDKTPLFELYKLKNPVFGAPYVAPYK